MACQNSVTRRIREDPEAKAEGWDISAEDFATAFRCVGGFVPPHVCVVLVCRVQAPSCVACDVSLPVPWPHVGVVVWWCGCVPGCVYVCVYACPCVNRDSRPSLTERDLAEYRSNAAALLDRMGNTQRDALGDAETVRWCLCFWVFATAIVLPFHVGLARVR